MTTKEKIEVMQAFEDGKEIEGRPTYVTKGGYDPGWHSIDGEPSWNWDQCKFRVKTDAPASLLSRIEQEYGEYKVVELSWGEYDLEQERLCLIMVDKCGVKSCHVLAQSMKGFYRYVYEKEDGTLFLYTSPTCPANEKKTYQPIAVLFTK